MLDPRGQLLRAAVGFHHMLDALLRSLWAIRRRLDSWSGIGRVAAGKHRKGYDLQLTRRRAWMARLLHDRNGHSPTSAGTGWECTPWHATKRAASEVLRQVSAND
jgi:hypothetical protein